jgi:hypothetical protein
MAPLLDTRRFFVPGEAQPHASSGPRNARQVTGTGGFVLAPQLRKLSGAATMQSLSTYTRELGLMRKSSCRVASSVG